MKLFLLTITFLSNAAFAGQINLSSGESITVQANTQTTVSCNGGGSSAGCADAIDSLKVLVDSCKTSYSEASCMMNKYWKPFVAANPECKMAALSLCINACKTAYSAAGCADWCVQ